MSTPFQTLCDLPQLGGDFFDTAYRPSSWPSLTFLTAFSFLKKLPPFINGIGFADVEVPNRPDRKMNALSEQLGSLQAADEQIRTAPAPYCCNGSIGCQCALCSSVRQDFMAALNRLCPQLAIAPPPPVELHPLPPSTLPPRMNAIVKHAARKPLNIEAPIPEDVPMVFSLSPIAPFRAVDLPLLPKPVSEVDNQPNAGSETPPDLVSHISRDRVPGVRSTAGSERCVFPLNLQPLIIGRSGFRTPRI